MKIIFILTICIPLYSCSPKNEFLKIQGSSAFAKSDALGLNRSELLMKYGSPITKDLVQQGNELIETFYYLEKINDVIITTKVKLKNDRVIEQLNDKLQYSCEKRIKELEYEVQRNRRATLNVN